MARQLHSVDRLFLDIETEDYSMGITPLFFYDPSGMEEGEFNYPRVVEHLDTCIRSIPVLCGRLHRVVMDLDNPYLVEDRNYRVENHVSHHVMAAPKDIKELSKAVNDFHRTTLDTNKPLWEALIISNIQVRSLPKNGFMLALKMHHAVADGMTVMDMTKKLHGLVPANPVSLPPARHLAKGGLFGMATRALSNNIRQSFNLVSPLLKLAPQASVKALNLMVESLGKKASPAPRTRFAGKPSDERVWGYAVFELERVKRLQKLFPGTSLNDVVLAIISGGLRNYLQENNELPEAALRVMAPVNVRTQEEASQAGNEISLMSLSLPVHLADPIERLLEASRVAKRTKENQSKLGNRHLSELVKTLPAAYLASINRLVGHGPAVNLIGQLGNIIVTNVPGPTQELSLLGAKLVNMSGCAPVAEGVGLLHPVVSYNGKLNIAVSSCPKMLPDVKHYIELLLASFEELEAATEQRYTNLLAFDADKQSDKQAG